MKVEVPSGHLSSDLRSPVDSTGVLKPDPLPKSRAESRDPDRHPTTPKSRTPVAVGPASGTRWEPDPKNRELNKPERRRPPKPARPARADRPKPFSLSHHERRCVVCRHPLRQQIEQEFLHWTGPRIIARQYGLSNGNPAGLYRHARAVGLWEKRFSWIRDSLAPILEQAWSVTATPASIVSAARVIARINAVGQWVEPADRVYLRDLFDRMTREELELYVRECKLPAWFEKEVSATPGILPDPPKQSGDANRSAGLPRPVRPDFVVGKPGKRNLPDPSDGSRNANA
jgi:hypothetical protein